MTIQARSARVHGRVQGVAFRHHTKVAARELGLCGWVRNLADGTVEVWIEGAPDAVESLCAWLEHGPPAARVTNVEFATEVPTGHVHFKVRFD